MKLHFSATLAALTLAAVFAAPAAVAANHNDHGQGLAEGHHNEKEKEKEKDKVKEEQRERNTSRSDKKGVAKEHAEEHKPSDAAPNGLPWVKAQVRRINVGAQTISLKHGEIPNLDMPSMTMVFKVKDAAMLQAVKAGDSVNVTIEEINGDYTITSWQAAM